MGQDRKKRLKRKRSKARLKRKKKSEKLAAKSKKIAQPQIP